MHNSPYSLSLQFNLIKLWPFYHWCLNVYGSQCNNTESQISTKYEFYEWRITLPFDRRSSNIWYYEFRFGLSERDGLVHWWRVKITQVALFIKEIGDGSNCSVWCMFSERGVCVAQPGEGGNMLLPSPLFLRKVSLEWFLLSPTTLSCFSLTHLRQNLQCRILLLKVHILTK